ncbi:MAG: diguanylate cyclase [Oscillospiraceae bacterium]
MKRITLVTINVIVCLVIFSGFLMISSLNKRSFNGIVENDIENISKLSSSTIYSQIDNSLTKPIFVGQTMANDLFLKNWLCDEPTGEDTQKSELIQQYLAKYQKKYEYDSVFLVSARSNIYYHYEGINKVVSKEDKHDVWYYDFIESNENYKLDVDFDEVNSNTLTVFVNCRVENTDGSLLGVVGVGIKMNNLQSLLKSYESEYNLKANLINEDGVVQVDSDEKNIETANFFDTANNRSNKEKILSNRDSMEVFWHQENDIQKCTITQYVDNLRWYLVIEKNTAPVRDALTMQFKQDLILVFGITALVLLSSILIIHRFKRLLISQAATDDVTGLPNYKMFEEAFWHNSKNPAFKQGLFFMFDIDNFKGINDEFGHMYGNSVLHRISQTTKTILGNDGFISRFGGDEFVGVIYGAPSKAKDVVQKIFAEMSGEQKNITVSMGVTCLKSNSKLDSLTKEADSAMYQAKNQGRNRIAYYDDAEKGCE